MAFDRVATAAMADDDRDLHERGADLRAALEEVSALWERRGEFRVIALKGEAGIGKSSFLQQLAEDASAQLAGLRIGKGVARSVATATSPFQPFRRVLEDLAGNADRDPGLKEALLVACRNYPEYLGAIPVLGNLAKAIGITERDLKHTRGAERLGTDIPKLYAEVLGEIAERQPLLVMLDDMHLSDESSVDLLFDLSDELSDKRLLVVVAFRGDDLERRGETHPLAVALDRLTRYRRVVGTISLERLTRAGVGRVFTDIKGRPPADTLLDWLTKQSEGVPYFIEEYIALLDDMGTWEVAGDLLDVSPQLLASLQRIPAGIASVLSERLRLIGTDTAEHRVLEGAAILGEGFTVADVAGVAAIPASETEAALRLVCQKYGLVRPDGTGTGYVFFHNLTQEFIEAQLLERNGPRHALLHRRAADYLQTYRLEAETVEWLSRVASHLQAADADAEAADWFLRAAGAAEELGGLGEAVTWAQAADRHAEAVNDVELRIRALRTLGRCTGELRRLPESRRAFETALVLAPEAQRDPTTRVGLELELAKAHRMENRWDAAREALKRAAATVNKDDQDNRARIGLLTAEVGLCGSPARMDDALATLDAATALTPNARMMASIHGHRGLVLLALGRRAEATAALTDAAAWAQRSGSPTADYESALFQAHLHLATFDLAAADRAIENMRALAREHGIGDTDVHRYGGRTAALAGRWDAAARSYLAFLSADLRLALEQPAARDWVLTHIEEQIRELRGERGAADAAEFAVRLADTVRSEGSDLERLSPGLQRWLDDIASAADLDLEDFERAAGTRDHAVSGSAIAAYRFYMPDPWGRCRAEVRV